MELYFLVFLIVGASVFFAWNRLFLSVTIYDFQKGLLYKNGSFKRELGAGRYHYIRARSMVQVFDLRKVLISLPGQEVLTKDNVNIKVTLVGFYEVVDPAKAAHQSENYAVEFYSFAQIILRDLISSSTIDEFLEKKCDIDAQLLVRLSEKAESLGLVVSAFSIRDIMLPANLKKAFSGVLEAKKEAQRQLEKARGEQAVLRNLSNSSSMYEGNPMLLQARLIQALSAGNNSIVFRADGKVALEEKARAP
ncbi:MAG: slipin family protein [Rhodospirillales bacterium]|nr:slipin family protein [Rhodospirillales bacterium]